MRSFVDTWSDRYAVLCRERRSAASLKAARVKVRSLRLTPDLAFYADVGTRASRSIRAQWAFSDEIVKQYSISVRTIWAASISRVVLILIHVRCWIMWPDSPWFTRIEPTPHHRRNDGARSMVVTRRVL